MSISTTQQSFSVGIVGAGRVVEELHLPVLKALPFVQVQVLCDLDSQRARSLAKRFQVPNWMSNVTEIPRVDVLLLAIPVGARTESFNFAYKNTIHVFCEKPFARTLKEFDYLVNRGRESSIEIGVGLMRRFFGYTGSLRNLLAVNVFGEPLEFYAGEGGQMRSAGRDASWYQNDPSLSGGGILIETGSHLLDQVIWSFGAQQYNILALQHESYVGLDYDIDFSLSLTLNQGKEVPGRIRLSRIHDIPTGIWIRFKNCTVSCGLTPDSTVTLSSPLGDALGSLHTNTGSTNVIDAFAQEWIAFFSQCESRKPSKVNAESGRLACALIEQCYTQIGGKEADSPVSHFGLLENLAG